MARRTRPPRNRKSRSPQAPAHDVAVTLPPEHSEVRVVELPRDVADPLGRSAAVPDDELAELDAGWD